MKIFFKYLYKFFLTAYIFESYNNFQKIKKNKLSFLFFKSFKASKTNKAAKSFFEKNSFKIDRFKKKSKFVCLKLKNEIVCSGWIHQGKNWEIVEINKKIQLKQKYLLYDFETEEKFRNQGYYKLLLQIIQNKFKKKRLMIYALSNNKRSIRAIRGSGFMLIKELKKY